MSCSSSGGAVSAKRKLNISPACKEARDSRSQHPAARYHTGDLLQSRASQVRFWPSLSHSGYGRFPVLTARWLTSLSECFVNVIRQGRNVYKNNRRRSLIGRSQIRRLPAFQRGASFERGASTAQPPCSCWRASAGSATNRDLIRQVAKQIDMTADGLSGVFPLIPASSGIRSSKSLRLRAIAAISRERAPVPRSA